MGLLIDALVFVLQLALAGFVLWGGLLCGQYWLRARDTGQKKPSAPKPAETKRFERVASLVLLALLCTTLAAL